MTAPRFWRRADGLYTGDCPGCVETCPATRFREKALLWAQRHVCSGRAA